MLTIDNGKRWYNFVREFCVNCIISGVKWWISCGILMASGGILMASGGILAASGGILVASGNVLRDFEITYVEQTLHVILNCKFANLRITSLFAISPL